MPDPFSKQTRAVALGLAALLALLPTKEALAASSDWVELEGGRIRIVADAPEEDGSIRAMLDIELQPGWKTYWRQPGPTGIPPELSIADSTNLTAATLHFPSPERIDDGYSVWTGYRQSVRLPIEMQKGNARNPARLVGQLTMGICAKICIPVQETIELDLGEASALETALVHQAFEALPKAADADFHVASLTLRPDDSFIALDVVMPAPPQAGTAESSPGEVFVAAPDGWRLGTPSAGGYDGRKARFRIPVEERPSETATPPTFHVVVATLTRDIGQDITLDLP